jgi:hypothetical protein
MNGSESILPMPQPGPARPIFQLWDSYVLGGRPVRVALEFWCASEADRVPTPHHAHPQRPDQVLTVRFFDLETGDVIPAASEAELSAALRCSSSPWRGA